jgi:hypothetical protein
VTYAIVFTAAVLALAAIGIVASFAAWARFLDPEGWRSEGRWARRPRLTRAIERVAFARLNPLRALIFWLVTTGIVLAFFAVPALAYVLGEL